jgi:tRNA(Ile)-lysidine synthase
MNLQRFLTASHREGWPGRARNLLVGCSGGADSTALLHLLRQAAPALGLGLRVLHVHHGLRGGEADGDARFVEALAARLGLPFECARVDVPARAKATGESVEQAARQLRLRAFRDVLERTVGDAVAVAHHLDDQAETLWMKVLRGVAPAGLAGMRPLASVEGVPLLRPLLDARAAELRAFLVTHRLEWREDRMNADPAHLRSHVRQALTPLLTRMNPRATEHAAALAAASAREEEWLGELTASARARATRSRGLNLAVLRDLPAALLRRVLRDWCDEVGASMRLMGAAGLERLVDLVAVGTGGYRAGSVLLRIESGELCRAGHAAGFDVAFQPPGEVDVGGGVLRAEFSTGWGRSGPGEVWASATRGEGRPLRVRSWVAGDAYRPHGAPGRRKLQDLFTDARIPRSGRSALPVVECDGEIVWVPGFRVAHDWAVESRTAPSIHLLSL